MQPRYVLIKKFCELVGYTELAVRRKIERGVCVIGKQYKRSPDGHLMIDMEGFSKWVEGVEGAA